MELKIADPTFDIWKLRQHPLHAVFYPRSVAVIGATEREGSVGRTLLWNLIGSPFGGTVFPVNPQRHSVLGIKAYPNIAAIPEPIDLAVIVTPAQSVPGVVRECADAGVKGAIIISAGFREIGAAGVELERQVSIEARRGKIRLIGPNCLGVMNPLGGLNATFAGQMARPGKVGFISQSGALCTSILDWSLQENVGFSAFISIGSMLDVGWGDLIEYLGDDPRTQCIVIYMESIGDARAFLSAAREVSLSKPIIVLKVGRTAAAAKAAASHTGALTGSDEVLSAAFRRCGVLRVDSISDLFDMAEVLGKQPRPRGKRLAIVTNAGGPGVIATDTTISGGGQLAELAESTIQKLNTSLPSHWSHGNPVDILGDADSDRYAQTMEVVMEDPNCDGVLAILTPQAMTNPTQTAERLKRYGKGAPKPLLASWMGGVEVAAGMQILNQSHIPTFAYPDAAVQAFNYMWRYTDNLRSIYETPSLPPDSDTHPLDRAAAAKILTTAQQSGRTILSEYEAKQLLIAYNMPAVPTEVAVNEREAIAAADRLGYPVVLKLHSHLVTHKTDVGGVRLQLRDCESVREAFQAIAAGVSHIQGAFLGVTVQPMVPLEGYELIVGSSLDAQFGAVMLFGAGGQLVEIVGDRALALPPLNTTLARRLMEQTHVYEALQGVRGRKPVDLEALAQLLVRFSQLVVEQPWIREIEINPLLASSDRLLALDARVILHTPKTFAARPVKPAIRPYPVQYVQPWTMKNGKEVTIRPIRPEDEPLMVDFHRTLSEESVYYRYAHLIKLQHRIAHDRLARICFIDYDREMLLVADCRDADTCQHSILAVGRLSRRHGTNEAEFALIVSDRYQCQGLGTEILRRLIEVGKAEKLDRIVGTILPTNRPMQHVCSKLGFTLRHDTEEEMMQVSIETIED